MIHEKNDDLRRKNFKRNPKGLNLQERKTSPYLGWIFFDFQSSSRNHHLRRFGGCGIRNR